MTPEPTQRPKPRGPLARRLLVGAAFAATFITGGLVFSGAAAAGMAMAHCGMGHPGAHGDMHAMMGAHIDKMLTEVGATPDQKSRVQAILKGAMESMGPLHQRLEGTHGDLHRILAAPVIDRDALEQLRAARIADIDQASRAMTKAIADAAEVLTPEQRATLAAKMAQHQP